jgi:MFS family permease
VRKKATNRLLVAMGVGLFLVALVNGGAETSLAVWWGRIQENLRVGDATMGTTQSGIALGLAIGAATAGYAMPRFGWRPTLLVGVLVFFPGLVLVPVPGVWVGAFAANVLWAFGNGLVDVVWGALASRFERLRARGRRDLLGLLALKELGAGLGVISGAIALEREPGVIRHLGIVAGVSVVLALAGATLIPRAAMTTKPVATAEPESPRVTAVPAGLVKQLRLLSLLAAASAVPLGAMYGWSTEMLERLGGEGGGKTFALGFFIALRFVTLAVAWALSSRIHARAWVMRGGLIALPGALVMSVGGWTESIVWTVVGAALIGGGLAAVSPMAASVAGESADAAGVSQDLVSAAVGRVIVVNHMAIFLGPIVVGGLSGLLGLNLALPLVMLGCAAAVVALGRRALSIQPTAG